MAKDLKELHKTTDEKELDLRGTFTFVMLLGVFMIASWAAVYYVFISR